MRSTYEADAAAADADDTLATLATEADEALATLATEARGWK